MSTFSISSIVWGGKAVLLDPDAGKGQYFGCTDLSVEPFWAACKLQGGHFHTGIDVPLITGTPLYAARAGVVTAVGWGLLQIQVAPNLWDLYVHVDRSVVKLGQHVDAGQLIAYSGNKVPSGGVTFGPHLHFEVQTGRLNFPGTALDPVPVLTAGRFASTGGSITARTTARSQEESMSLWKDSEGRVFEKTREYGKEVKYLVEAPQVAAYVAAGVPICISPKATVNGVTDDWIDNSVKFGPAVAPVSGAIDLSSITSAISAATADLKTAIANIKVTGGGLTPEQDLHLATIEQVAARLTAAGKGLTG